MAPINPDSRTTPVTRPSLRPQAPPARHANSEPQGPVDRVTLSSGHSHDSSWAEARARFGFKSGGQAQVGPLRLAQQGFAGLQAQLGYHSKGATSEAHGRLQAGSESKGAAAVQTTVGKTRVHAQVGYQEQTGATLEGRLKKTVTRGHVQAQGEVKAQLGRSLDTQAGLSVRSGDGRTSATVGHSSHSVVGGTARAQSELEVSRRRVAVKSETEVSLGAEVNHKVGFQAQAGGHEIQSTTSVRASAGASLQSKGQFRADSEGVSLKWEGSAEAGPNVGLRQQVGVGNSRGSRLQLEGFAGAGLSAEGGFELGRSREHTTIGVKGGLDVGGGVTVTLHDGDLVNVVGHLNPIAGLCLQTGLQVLKRQ